MKCLKKGCNGEAQEVMAPYMVRFQGLIRNMQRYQCKKCATFWTSPVSVCSEKEFKKYKAEQAEKARQFSLLPMFKQ